MGATNKPLSKLRQVLTKFPQEVVSFPVHSKPPWETMPDVLHLVKEVESKLADRGRVLLRYSGTEPKARLLVEGQNRDQVHEFVEEIMAEIRRRIDA